jgi:putative ABC transport system substrate-binding protein
VTRQTVIIVALGLFLWSFSAPAQQSPKVPLVGILTDEALPLAAKSLEPFAQGLRDLGWIEGHNITFARRSAAEKYETLPSLAAELVGLQPDVILATGTLAARAAKRATQTIPIVFARSGDPVGWGLVASLARPGGNLTEFSTQFIEIVAKRVELLIIAAPEAKRVGALWVPSDPLAAPFLTEIERAARSLNLELVPAGVSGPNDFEPALRAAAEQRVGALILVPAVLFSEYPRELVDLTVKARLPTIFDTRAQVEMGGLMTYGPSASTFGDVYRRAAAYVDKILKGAKPADLPVQQPTKFELVINLKTAKALGLSLPYTLLGRADEVIE